MYYRFPLGNYNLRTHAKEHLGEILSVDIEYQPCPTKILLIPHSLKPENYISQTPLLKDVCLIPKRDSVTRDINDRIKVFFFFLLLLLQATDEMFVRLQR